MVNLAKGQKVSLTKEAPNMSKMIVGLGWDVNVEAGRGLFRSNDFDLDAAAIVLRNGKFSSRKDMIYFGNLAGADGAVKHCGDNLTGAGDGDDEQIIVDLSKLASDIDKIVIIVTIYQAKKRKQNFGQVQNAFVRICDEGSGNEVLKFNLTDSYADATAMIFGELYRYNGEWKFNPIGEGIKEESVSEIAARYA